jgi:hypothetical protein
LTIWKQIQVVVVAVTQKPIWMRQGVVIDVGMNIGWFTVLS